MDICGVLLWIPVDAVSVCLVLHSLSYARLVRAHDKDNMIHKPDASEIAQDKKNMQSSATRYLSHFITVYPRKLFLPFLTNPGVENQSLSYQFSCS